MTRHDITRAMAPASRSIANDRRRSTSARRDDYQRSLRRQDRHRFAVGLAIIVALAAALSVAGGW